MYFFPKLLSSKMKTVNLAFYDHQVLQLLVVLVIRCLRPEHRPHTTVNYG